MHIKPVVQQLKAIQKKCFKLRFKSPSDFAVALGFNPLNPPRKTIKLLINHRQE